jgi:hypothetical protein
LSGDRHLGRLDPPVWYLCNDPLLFAFSAAAYGKHFAFSEVIDQDKKY